MKTITPFEEHSEQYDEWFENHPLVYQSELNAVRELLPNQGTHPRKLEVGIGSGRFALPLGFDMGIDPAQEMLDIARQRGLITLKGVGEYLPFPSKSFDVVLLVTTLCFLQDVDKTFNEIRRILRPRGKLIIGYVDRASFLGKMYNKHKNESVFYEGATFYSTEEVKHFLTRAGFSWYTFRQTIFTLPMYWQHLSQPETVREGYGDGGFVAVVATKTYTDEPM